MLDDPFKNIPNIFGGISTEPIVTASQIDMKQRQQEILLRTLLERRIESMGIQTDIRTSFNTTVLEVQMLDTESSRRAIKTFSHNFMDIMERSIMFSGSPELKITIKELEEMLVLAKHTLITRLISN